MGCGGARFHGHNEIAKMLTFDNVCQDIIPPDEFKRPEVIAVRRAEHEQGKACLSFAPEHAIDLFKTAVRLTIDHGESVKTPKQSVGGSLDICSIPRKGETSCHLVQKGEY